MSAGGRTAASVEVRYTPTAADFREARAAWDRHTAAGRRARRGRYTIAACPAVLSALLGAAGWAGPLPGVLMLGALLLLLAPPRLQLRRVTRLAADKGEFRVLVDDYGVVVENEDSVTELGWPEQRYHLETPGLLLLLGGSEETGVLTMLPKRGIEDVRRLEELIDRHATALVPE
ncbi:hypothetical protein ACFRMQ_07235 [Kitasatospora sp. NPDC056783]|uniref:hypothetical protein n=1 Tax=Kitasatospora sp. NPDC056783 TaxID=3345943 RepID=UPI0036AC485F